MMSESAMKIFGFWRKPSEQLVKSPYYILITKGQLISKGVLMSSISSKQQTKEFDFTTQGRRKVWKSRGGARNTGWG